MIVALAFDIIIAFATNIFFTLGQGEVRREEWDSQMQSLELWSIQMSVHVHAGGEYKKKEKKAIKLLKVTIFNQDIKITYPWDKIYFKNQFYCCWFCLNTWEMESIIKNSYKLHQALIYQTHSLLCDSLKSIVSQRHVLLCSLEQEKLATKIPKIDSWSTKLSLTKKGQ